MIFNLHPWKYRVRVCPGPLLEDGEEVLATTHGRDILIAGDVAPTDRLGVLIDQLRRLRVRRHGAMDAEGVNGFTADVTRQLNAQGGEGALLRLCADGMVHAGGAEDIPAEPVGCECMECGTRYAPHQIRTSGPESDPASARPVVKREVDCDFCGHTMHWVEGATAAGAPNGRVVTQPWFTRPGAAAVSHASGE